MGYRDSGYSVRDLGIEPDEYRPSKWDERDDDPKCTCTWAAYVKYAGGTGCDISEYDPHCPEHGELRAEGDAGDPDPADRYEQGETGTVEDYQDW